MAERDAVDPRLHRARILAPTRHHRDVLFLVDHERRGRRVNAGIRRLLPQHLAGHGVEGAEQAIVGSSTEHQAAAGRQDRAPVGRVFEIVAPRLLSGVDVPRLHLADVVRTRGDVHLIGRRCPPAAARRFHDAPDHHRTKIFLRRDIHQACLWIEGARLPVLPAVPRRAETGGLADVGPVIRIDVRPPALRVQAPENVLLHVRFAIDEPDRAAAALEKIQIPAACEVDQSLDRLAVAREIDQQRRGDFVEVPGFVWRVLEVALDRAGGRVYRHRRRGVEIVARSLGGHPGIGVADSPEQQVCFRIVVAGDPRRAASGFPLISLRPRLAAGLSGCRDGEAAPRFLAGVGIVRRDKAARWAVTTRDADDHLAVGDERGRRHVVPLLVVLDHRSPGLFAGPGVDGNENGFAQCDKDSVTVECHAAVDRFRHSGVRRTGAPVPPQFFAGSGVERDHLVVRRRDEHHAVVDNRRGLVTVVHPRRPQPHGLQPFDSGGSDLVERTIAPPVIRATDHEPVAVLRLLEPVCGHRLVHL